MPQLIQCWAAGCISQAGSTIEREKGISFKNVNAMINLTN